MGWCRTNRRIGAALALVALWLQFVVSFAHVHPEDLLGYGRASGATVASVTDASRHPGTSVPDDNCPICESIFLVGSALPALQPCVCGPASVGMRRAEIASGVELKLRQRVPFQTRAPPAA